MQKRSKTNISKSRDIYHHSDAPVVVYRRKMKAFDPYKTPPPLTLSLRSSTETRQRTQGPSQCRIGIHLLQVKRRHPTLIRPPPPHSPPRRPTATTNNGSPTTNAERDPAIIQGKFRGPVHKNGGWLRSVRKHFYAAILATALHTIACCKQCARPTDHDLQIYHLDPSNRYMGYLCRICVVQLQPRKRELRT